MEWRERWWEPVMEGVVEAGELSVEDADRPSVGDDVVHGEEEDVVEVVELDE